MLFAEYFVSDAAAGMVKIVSLLTGTVSLQTLGKLYYSFGIGAQTVEALSLSLDSEQCFISE